MSAFSKRSFMIENVWVEAESEGYIYIEDKEYSSNQAKIFNFKLYLIYMMLRYYIKTTYYTQQNWFKDYLKR